MEYYSKIRIYENPILWFNDKWNTIFKLKSAYLSNSIPGLIFILGVCANFWGIFQIAPNKLTAVLLFFLFIYGIINLLYITANQRKEIHLNRIKNYFDLIHQNIIHQFRDYIAERDYNNKKGTPIVKERIEEHIEGILGSFNDIFMRENHDKNTVATLKYKIGNKLHPIRVGKFIDNRSNTPEELKNSYIYTALNKPKNRLKFIYVKNINKLDNYEMAALSADFNEIKKRALNQYKTFIALPIRSSALEVSTTTLKIKRDLGIIGFDLKKEYGFGNIYEHEIEIICCLADLLSIIVEDLVTTTNNKTK